MTKQTKDTPKVSKKNINFKAKAGGLYDLAVALAELASVYVFATQDTKVLWVLAGVLGVDCAFRFASRFLR